MNTDIAAQKAIDRLKRQGFENLSDIDKTIATAWLTEAAVGNNGFARFFASRRGDIAFYTPTALATIGATKLAAITSEANAVFGPAGPSHDYRTRRAQTLAFDHSTLRTLRDLEDRYYACAEDVDELLDTFLNPPKAKSARN